MCLVLLALMILLGLVAVYGWVGLLFSVGCLFLCGYCLAMGLFDFAAGWVFGGWFACLWVV